ncbi:glutathione-regulated potassium-efflux system protein KefC [bacterium BMS3Bbin06]|nr:glutathione-regulated potassium-efflux system protein KefC [bacterium BMS3Abin08]GBE34153.1 glutathione-regulated potassium-efflux system protein KefC [bacterium BMS3Bbin06]
MTRYFLLFAVVAGASIVPLIAGRLRIPSAVLEILYGILLFNLLINHYPPWLSLLKELGLLYLMFIAGMELDARTMIRDKRLCWYLLIPMLSFIITPFITYQIGLSAFTGIVLAVTSAGIIIPALKESGILRTETGRDIVGIALMGELISILILTGMDIHHQYGITIMAAVKTFELLAFLGLAGIFLRVLYLIAWWFPEKVERVMENEDPIEEGIRAVFLIALIGSIEAYSVGVEPILGSFLAGIIFNYVFKSKERFEEKINAVGFGFLTPFFFIGVGAEFDIQGLYSLKTVSIALLLSLLVFVSNLLPVIFSRLMKIKGLESVSISLILSAPLTMLLVATTVGVKLGLIDEGLKNALILASIITAILYPFIFRISVKRLTSSSEPAPQS